MSKPRFVFHKSDGRETAYNLGAIFRMSCGGPQGDPAAPELGLDVHFDTGHVQRFEGELARKLWEGFKAGAVVVEVVGSSTPEPTTSPKAEEEPAAAGPVASIPFPPAHARPDYESEKQEAARRKRLGEVCSHLGCSWGYLDRKPFFLFLDGAVPVEEVVSFKRRGDVVAILLLHHTKEVNFQVLPAGHPCRPQAFRTRAEADSFGQEAAR